MKFINLNKGPMAGNAPKWQEDVIARVEREYEQEAINASEAVRKAMEAKPDLAQGYFVTYLDHIMRETPRYAYIKHISAPNGDEYEAEIDLLLHTVAFIKVED